MEHWRQVQLLYSSPKAIKRYRPRNHPMGRNRSGWPVVLGGVLLALLAALFWGTRVWAGQAPPPISITWSADLRFGEVAVSTLPGTVSISPAGSRTVSGGVLGLGSSYGPASFTISGGRNAKYVITLPTSAVASNGVATMTVDTFTSNPSGTGKLDGSGSGVITVGATLHVAAAQAPGDYRGVFEVSVDYQ